MPSKELLVILSLIASMVNRICRSKNMEKRHLPVFGVGPVYGAMIINLTIVGILLKTEGIITSGTFFVLKLPFLIMGILIIILGVVIFVRGQIDLADNIQKNNLVTTGVYANVRNPLYSAFMLVCTGALLCANNLWLLILPFIYWLLITVLMKNTEEKWLRDLYGQEYMDYCKRVNRCIPWLRNRNIPICRSS